MTVCLSSLSKIIERERESEKAARSFKSKNSWMKFVVWIVQLLCVRVCVYMRYESSRKREREKKRSEQTACLWWFESKQVCCDFFMCDMHVGMFACCHFFWRVKWFDVAIITCCWVFGYSHMNRCGMRHASCDGPFSHRFIHFVTSLE